MTTYPPPTPAQVAAYRASFHRRHRGFLAINGVLALCVIAWLRWGDRLLDRPGGVPLWFVAAAIGVSMLALVGAVLVWQCPRCHQTFGRQFVVEECPECHLRFFGD